MAASNKVIILLRTFAGPAARVALLVAAAVVDPSGAAVAAIKAAIDALSSAKVMGSSISQPANLTTTSAAGVYEDDQDKADFTFKSADGQYHTWRVPAPPSAIFNADGTTLNTGNAAVIAFAAYITANCVSPTGAAISALVGGRRIRLNAGRRA